MIAAVMVLLFDIAISAGIEEGLRIRFSPCFFRLVCAFLSITNRLTLAII